MTLKGINTVMKHPYLSAAVAGAILGAIGPLWWWYEWLQGHYVGDGTGTLERIIPLYPLSILSLMAPSTNPAVPSSYLGVVIALLMANMAFFSIGLMSLLLAWYGRR